MFVFGNDQNLIHPNIGEPIRLIYFLTSVAIFAMLVKEKAGTGQQILLKFTPGDIGNIYYAFPKFLLMLSVILFLKYCIATVDCLCLTKMLI
jgi:hypothetical protein